MLKKKSFPWKPQHRRGSGAQAHSLSEKKKQKRGDPEHAPPERRNLGEAEAHQKGGNKEAAPDAEAQSEEAARPASKRAAAEAMEGTEALKDPSPCTATSVTKDARRIMMMTKIWK